MSIRTFFSNIGNAFKTGYNNGNLGKGLQIGGAAAMVTALTAAAIKGDSIFGGSGCCHSGNMYGGYNMFGDGMFGGDSIGVNTWGSGTTGYNPQINTFGVDPYLMQNPMAILNYAGSEMYGGGMMYSQAEKAGTNLYNYFLNKVKAQNAANLTTQTEPTGTVKKLDAKHADLPDDVDSAEGERFDEELTKMSTDGSGSTKLFKVSTDDESAYTTSMTTFAQSYLKSMDADDDGKITKEEFLKKFAGKDAKIDTDKENSLNALFGKVNQNKDEYIDYKELAALLTYLDTDSNKKLDGSFTNEEFAAKLKKLNARNDSSVAKTLLDIRKKYFK